LPWRKEMSSDPVTQAHAQRWLGQDTLQYTTQADLKDLYDILVENGIHLESPEVSIAVKDQAGAAENYVNRAYL
jgi:2-hydroxychromene-2-carboxylate isomerase